MYTCCWCSSFSENLHFKGCRKRFRQPVLLQYAGENGIISNQGIAAEAKSVYHPKGKDVMCGIVGFVGSEQAAPILLEGLERLE